MKFGPTYCGNSQEGLFVLLFGGMGGGGDILHVFNNEFYVNDSYAMSGVSSFSF